MNFQINNQMENSSGERRNARFFDWRWAIVFAAMLILSISPLVFAQTSPPPKAEKIISDYHKAAGGKKRLAAIKSAVYGWKFKDDENGDSSAAGRRARTQIQNPVFFRFDAGDADSALNAAATLATNGSTVWRRDAESGLRTLTDAESQAVRLQSMLAATRLNDLKRQRVAAQVVGRETVEGETAYVVEFSVRGGAKIRYFFGADSKLPVKIENAAARTSVCPSDYRDAGNGVLEARKLIEPCDGAANFAVFELEKVSYNAVLDAALFDPPRTLENFDLAALVEELKTNEAAQLERLGEYGFVQNEIERVFDGKGLVKKETRRVYEVFPTRDGKRILKLVSENGIPLAGEKLAREERRVAKDLTEAEENYEKERQKRAVQPANGNSNKLERQRDGDAPTENGLERQAVLTLLRTGEIYAPRIEFFRDREAIVVNFRPRPGFKPRGFVEAVFSKLAGTVWIDAAEKQVIRVETRVTDNVKIGGGLLATFRKDSAIVFERAKFGDVWLPKSFQANASAKFLLVGGFDASSQIEYGDYNRFESEVKDYKVGSPNEQKPPNQP